MSQKNKDSIFFSQELLTVEGQIVKFLLEKERAAGEIYNFVRASQTTISRKIARMINQGMIECRISTIDRRVPIYKIADSYLRFLHQDAAESVDL